MRTLLLVLLACSSLLGCTAGRDPNTTKTPPDMEPMLPLFPDCNDGFADQGESDVDCGGPCMKKCGENYKCKVKGDCASGICLSGVCASSTICSDGAMDGDETDVDCGGSCPACIFGKVCAKPTDCKSGTCTAGHCAALKLSLAAGRPVDVGMQPVALVARDFDGDGILDVAALSGAMDKVYVALGKGDGKFAAPVGSACPAGGSPDVMAAGDIDGDGLVDLIVTTNGMTLALINTSTTGMPSFKAGKAVGVIGSSPNNPILVDLDGDNKPDLVTVDTDYDAGLSGYDLYVTMNAGGGMWKAPHRYFVGADEPITPQLADFDNDSHLDLAVLLGAKVAIALGKGDGTFGGFLGSNIGTFNASRITVGDFDPDGHMDVLALDRSNGLGFMAGLGDGTLLKVLKSMAPNSPIAAVPADFDLDGKLDIATLGYNDDFVTIYVGTGSRMVAQGPAIVAGSSATAVIVADMNADGHPDILTANPSDDKVYLILNTSK